MMHKIVVNRMIVVSVLHLSVNFTSEIELDGMAILSSDLAQDACMATPVYHTLTMAKHMRDACNVQFCFISMYREKKPFL